MSSNSTHYLAQMKPKEIRSKLILKEVTGKMIADELGVTKQAISMTIYGKRKNPKIRQGIAKHLGLSIEFLWPGKD